MGRLRLGVLISGRGSNLQALIEACRAPDYPAEVALVISNEPDAAGLDRAAAAGIATKTIDHRDFPDREAFDAALDQALAGARVELVALAGFMRLLSDGFVGRWRDRLINIHPSLLPAFKGLNVHRRVLAAGVRISGCTVHFVRPEMDQGPIIVQAAVPVSPDDTEASLAARVLACEHLIYPLAVRLIATGKVTVTGEIVRLADSPAAADYLINPPDGAKSSS